MSPERSFRRDGSTRREELGEAGWFDSRGEGRSRWASAGFRPPGVQRGFVMSRNRGYPANAPRVAARLAARRRELARVGEGHRMEPAAGARGPYAPFCTSIFLVADSAAFFLPSAILRTPLSKLADTWSASTSGGSWNDRRKTP